MRGDNPAKTLIFAITLCC